MVIVSADEILAECATAGTGATTPVVFSCFKDARAADTLVALNEAGIENVRLCFGSRNDWSRDPSLPIEEGLPYAKPTTAATAPPIPAMRAAE